MVLVVEAKKVFIALIKIIIVLAAFIALAIAAVNYFFPMKYEDTIERCAKKYGLEESLVYAVINTESHFEETAVSGKSACGLMQIMKPTAEWIAVKSGMTDYKEEKICDPDTNIELGCWYLSYLIKKYDNDMTLVIAAYNAGEGNVTKWLYDTKYSENGQNLDNIPFRETEEYVERVNFNKEVYEKLIELRRKK
ncbi:MAG: lytic transglycosylase domain-containing protein [Firmicutes bacterium]|nr:lytic transglycosylase domain-containing protein [Bacillota bacterium]